MNATNGTAIKTDMKKNHGMSLIELIVTLLVLGILAAVAVPNVIGLISSNRISTETNTIASALSLSRSEAIKRNVTVTLCSSADGATCSGAGGCGWENGWLVFTDFDNAGAGNGQVDAGSGDVILKVGEPAGGTRNVTVCTQGFGNLNFIRYSPNGFSLEGSGSFKICDDRGVDVAKAINVKVSGHPNLAIDTNDADRVVEDILGVNITCP